MKVVELHCPYCDTNNTIDIETDRQASCAHCGQPLSLGDEVIQATTDVSAKESNHQKSVTIMATGYILVFILMVIVGFVCERRDPQLGLTIGGLAFFYVFAGFPILFLLAKGKR